MTHSSLIAIDIGNTQTKFGLYEPGTHGDILQPVASFAVPTPQISSHAEADETLAAWIADHQKSPAAADVSWWIGSVHREATKRLEGWLTSRFNVRKVQVLTHDDFPITLDVEHPEKVGIDRVAGACAANRLRSPDRAAIVADLGTAITVDLISADGVFRGGAILPGIGLSARALHEFTAQLPLIPMNDLTDAVKPLGRNTTAAMQSGLFWGAVGAMRELIARLSVGLSSRPDVFLTGGAVPAVAKLLGETARYEPHLVLSGIALAATQRP